MQPRGHQIEAVDAALKTFQANDRAQLRMACGTGKTYIAALIKQQIPSAVTVFFAPTIYLVHQAHDAWRKHAGELGHVLSVCCKTVSASDEELLGALAQVTTVTTKADKIRECLMVAERVTIFCTYKSAPKLITVLKQIDKTVDFVVCDEAHYIAGRDNKTVQCIFRDLNARKVLFLTATPRVSDLEDAIGMNDEQFGPVAYELGFKRAVELEILCPYHIQLTVLQRPNDKAAASLNDGVAVEALKRTASDGYRRGLAFHNSIQHARRFHDLLKEHLPEVPTFTLSYRSSIEERDNAIEAVRANGGVITNVSVLGEGFDFPELDHMCIVEPRSSTVEIAQNIGRILRKSSGKVEARAIVPIVFDPAEGLAHEKRRVVSVIKALAMHDETLAAAIANLNYSPESSREFQDVLNGLIEVKSADVQIPEALLAEVRHSVLTLFIGKKVNHAARLMELQSFVREHNRLPLGGLLVPESESNLRLWMKQFPALKTAADYPEIVSAIRAIQEEYTLVGYAELVQLCGLPNTYRGRRDGLKKKLLQQIEDLGIKAVVERKEEARRELWFKKSDVERVIRHFKEMKEELLATHVLVSSFSGRSNSVTNQRYSSALRKFNIQPLDVPWVAVAAGERPTFVTRSEAAKIIEWDEKQTLQARGLERRKELVLELLGKGLSCSEVAKKLGIGVDVAYHYLRTNKVA